MDKIKDVIHGGHKKEGQEVQHSTTTATTGGGYGQPGFGQTTTGTPITEGTGEKKHGGHFGLGGHQKVNIFQVACMRDALKYLNACLLALCSMHAFGHNPDM